MLNNIATSGGMAQAQARQSLLQKLDTDSDNKISRQEFVAGRPQDVEEDEAGSLFDKLDSSGQGYLSVSSSMQSVLLKAQESTQGGQGHRGGPGGGPPDPSRLAEELDSDADGSVSREEFVAGRPQEVSEEEAGAFFDKIASAAGTDGTSGLSQEQLTRGMEKAGPPDGAEPSGQTASGSGLTASGALLEELLKAIGSYQKASLLGGASSQAA